jgi:hypothetical protein
VSGDKKVEDRIIMQNVAYNGFRKINSTNETHAININK